MEIQSSEIPINGNSARNGSSSRWLESVSPGMRTVEAVIRELSQNDVPVLVVAETGAGKRAAAERIHDLSDRSSEPFNVYQGADVSKSTFNSLERQGGTIYLHDIEELIPPAQLELVRLLSVERDRRSLPRVICGTSRELEPDVKVGKFREDLYYRISSVCLRLPPLRQRKEDIPLLRNAFLAAAARDLCRQVPSLSPDTHKFFVEYHWPGNIRELKDASVAIVALGDESLAMGGLRSLLRRGDSDKVSLKEAARAASREAEKELILRVLTRTRWNRRRAAQELKISYKALLYKLKQIGYQEFGA